MARRKISGLGGFSIRELIHTDGDMIRLKLHSKAQRATRYIEVRADALFDGDGNLFENNAPYIPRAELEGN